MPQTREITVYSFEELSDQAKERARDWYREGNLDYEWWDSSYDDFETIAGILGIELDYRPQNNPKAQRRPCIWFSGFCSQGDGACFEGRYTYAKGASKRIREHAPEDTELHEIADQLQALQRKYFYGLEARVKQVGRYQHEHSTEIEVFDKQGSGSPATDEVSEILRSFMRWIYRSLEKEHDYLQSDECVDESIQANEYEFDESGHIA